MGSDLIKMKKIIVLLSLSLFFPIQAQEPLLWDKQNGFADWTEATYCSVNVTKDGLLISKIKSDSRITNSKLSIDSSQYNLFTYTYKSSDAGVSRGGQLYFARRGENCSDSRMIPLPALKTDGKWHTVTVDMSKNKHWLGTEPIALLRLDLTDAAGGSIKVADIRVSAKKFPVVWNRDNNFADWDYAAHASRSIQNGSLVLTDIKQDCQLFNTKVQIDPEKYNCFVVRYRAEGTGGGGGQLYFSGTERKGFSDRYRWLIPPMKADGQWHEMKLTVKNIIDPDSWVQSGTITSLRFDPIDSAGGKIEIAEIRFEEDKSIRPMPKVKSELDAPLWPKVKPETWTTIDRHTGAYFTGKMICSPDDDVRRGKKKGSEYFLRKEIAVDKDITAAMVQFCADDCAQLIVNGKTLAFSNDWRNAICADITPYIGKGKNVLGFHYFNSFSYGGVLAEIYIQYRDGSSDRIGTDKTFRCSSVSDKKWMDRNFDDSAWSPAAEQEPPPAAPWHVRIAYRRFDNIQKVTSVSLSDAVVDAGKTISIKAKGEGKLPEKPIDVTIILRKGTRVFWEENVSLDKKYFSVDKDKWTLEYPYDVPMYIAGQMSMQLVSSSLSFAEASDLKFEIKPVKCDPAYPEKAVCRVVNRGNGPYFELNGNPLFLNWGMSGTSMNRMVRFSTAKINAVTVSGRNWWPQTGVFDLAAFDREAEFHRKNHPHAYFIMNIFLNPPRDWEDKYPDEMCRDEKNNTRNDGYLNYSYFSKQARKDMTEAMLKAIGYLEKQPYANRIIAYRITGGGTSEWLGWEARSGFNALDFAKPAQAAYRKLLQDHYPQIKDHSIPLQKERIILDDEALLWDPQKHLRTILFYELQSQAVADMMSHLCLEAKKKLEGRKAVGAYYGYVCTLNWTGVSQMRSHYALRRVIEAKAADFLMSPPSYPLRHLGDTCGDMKPFATMLHNNIIPVIEDDSRTHNNINVMHRGGSATQTLTEKQTIHFFRRNMGIAIARLEPAYYYTISQGGELDFPAMAKEIDIRGTTGQHCTEKQAARNAEIALVVSEKSITSTPFSGRPVKSGRKVQHYTPDGSAKVLEVIRPILNYETFVGNQNRFSRCGAPTDYLLAEDLEKNPGDYKLYVFLNCYNFDQSFLNAVNKLKQRKCVLLWLYAPGWIFDRQSGVENMKKLTGFDFREEAQDILPAVTLADGRLMGTPSLRVKPVFSVVTDGAEVIGKYENGNIGAAALKTGNALSVFCGAWQLDMPFINEIAKRAGVFRYTESDDPFEANDSFIVLHARSGGRKTVRLPRKCDVLDIYENKIIARNTDCFEFEIGIHETKSFYYADDADLLLKKLQALP